MRRWRRPAPGVEMVEVLEPDPAVIAEGRWYAAARGTGDLVGLGAVAFDAIEREDGPALERLAAMVRDEPPWGERWGSRCDG